MRDIFVQLEHFFVIRVGLEETEIEFIVHDVLVPVLHKIKVLIIAYNLHVVFLIPPFFKVTDIIPRQVGFICVHCFEVWSQLVRVDHKTVTSADAMDKAFPHSLNEVIFCAVANLHLDDVLEDVLLMLLVAEEDIAVAVLVDNETILLFVSCMLHSNIKPC